MEHLDDVLGIFQYSPRSTYLTLRLGICSCDETRRFFGQLAQWETVWHGVPLRTEEKYLHPKTHDIEMRSSHCHFFVDDHGIKTVVELWDKAAGNPDNWFYIDRENIDSGATADQVMAAIRTLGGRCFSEHHKLISWLKRMARNHAEECLVQEVTVQPQTVVQPS